MSLSIKITKEQIEAEIKRSQALTPGWYEFELTEVTSELAKDKASMNYIVIHTLAADPGRSIKHFFNNKPFGQTFMIKLFAALNGIPVQEFLDKLGTEFELNFANIKGKHVMGKVIHSQGDGGKIFSNIEDWAPIGKVPF